MNNILSKKDLPDVTLITVDCLYLKRSKAGADICQKNFNFGAVKILSSIPDPDPRVVPIPPLNNGKLYSDFYIDELWKYVDTPLALTYHHDGFILNPDAWEDEFLNYDYIGPPWHHPSAHKIGNGGFAIRSRRLLEYLAKNREKIGGPFKPEDLWTCETARPYLEKEGMTFAPIELARRWGKEGNERGVVWNGEFGWHNIRSTDISKWLDKNPEYKEVFVPQLNDFTQFMRKYPVYDGTVQVLSAKPIQVDNYRKLGSGEKNYDCVIDRDLLDFDPVKPGHKIVYRLWRILLEQVGVPTFERTIKNVEKFKSKTEILQAHPDIKITPSFYLPKWRQRLISIFGNSAFPDNKPYTIFWYDKNIGYNQGS